MSQFATIDSKLEVSQRPSLTAVLAGLVFLVSCLTPLNGQEIKYTLSFPNAAQHCVDIELEFEAESESVEVMMPVWTPGSYLVREYPRFVQNVRATGDDGASLVVSKTRKNRWAIEAGEPQRIRLQYRVYGRELSVRTNWIDSDLAVLNGAATFMVPREKMATPIQLEIELPPQWPRSICPLPADPDNAHIYTAQNFDQLVDSPILCGDCHLFPFQVDGVNHYLVNLGDTELWDGPRAAHDLKKLVEAQKEFWGELPYPEYYFLNVIMNAGGGLEHDNSTLLMSNRRAMNSPVGYRRWLTLCSHELFHAWNVRRLRPTSLLEYDYENEVYTRELWIAEGITSYYESLLLARAGLMTEKELLGSLSAEIKAVETRPGNLVQSLTESSFDTWIDFYRPHENSPNTSVSYYSRGAVAGLMLDCELRRQSRGKVSLDDVLRKLYEDYRETGYQHEDLRKVCETLTGKDFADWFERYIEQANVFPYADSLKVLGLQFVAEEEGGMAFSPGDARLETNLLGITLRDAEGQTRISAIRSGSAGEVAGLNLEDEILAINGRRVNATTFSEELRDVGPPAQLELLISRRGRLREVDVTIGPASSEPSWQLMRMEKPSRRQKQQWIDWIGENSKSRSQDPSASETK
ncbi:MAG: M61 family metallopeptidase [Planctomycetaceae bacterium]|nr:M61 family metallopeptidase [Planctomycetaceae bacterium]